MFIIYAYFELVIMSSKELPVLSYTIDNSGHKSYYKITYEGFTNQLGESFSTENYKR